MKFKRVISCILSIAMISSAIACSSPAANSESTTDSGADTKSVSASAESSSEETVAEEPSTKKDAPEETNSEADTKEEAKEETAKSEAAPEEKGGTEEDVPSGDISLLWEDSRVYTGTSLGQYYIMPTYSVKGYEDVPFVKASDYVNIAFEKKAYLSFEDGVLYITRNDTKASIDPASDTVYFENPSRFRSDSLVDGAILEVEEMNVVTTSLKNKSTQTAPEPITISLDDYNMPVMPFEDDVLMPFLALQNTLGAICWSNVLVYNGKDYYNVSAISSYTMTHEDVDLETLPYAKALYTGPFSEKGTPTQDYANYNYYSICLLLDLYFGHKEERNITTFDEYFTRINAKESLCSTDFSSVAVAETLVFFYLFDSGHDAFLGIKNVFGDVAEANSSQAEEIINNMKDSEEGNKLFDDDEDSGDEEVDPLGNALMGALIEKGFKIPEIAPTMAWSTYFSKTLPENYGHERLDYVDDTAVIYFDVFKDNPKRDPSFYLDPMTEDDIAENNFVFFYNCFEDIKTHKDVKNVVINLSNNGGGAASALITILGFLSKDGEVKITNLDLVSKSYREECYHVDTNLDGIADDNDGYGGQYDFFIMTSPSSYSCGNALPYFAQQYDLAKIIGTRPGGGDCVVGNYVDAYGYNGSFSGMLKLGKMENGQFISNETATVPDLNMMTSLLDFNSVPWFDPEGITDAVHQYKDGKTEIDYEDNKLDSLANALITILTPDEEEE